MFLFMYMDNCLKKKNYENDGYSAVNSNPLIIIIST